MSQSLLWKIRKSLTKTGIANGHMDSDRILNPQVHMHKRYKIVSIFSSTIGILIISIVHLWRGNLLVLYFYMEERVTHANSFVEQHFNFKDLYGYK